MSGKQRRDNKKQSVMRYADRSGGITEVFNGQDKLLGCLYGSVAGRALLKVLIRPAVSKVGGLFLDMPISALFIKPFVKKNGIDLDLYEGRPYRSYNQFFTRKIKPEHRPIDADANSVIAPCDGKLSVYKIQDGSSFCIKNTQYTLKSLVKSERLAKHFEGGYICVFRLTVDDYHRYCYVDGGRKSVNIKIPGVFHTVNPVANGVYPIYKENTREFSLLKSDHFGAVLMMEVGALLVGKINNSHGACAVNRGQEKGRFEFGGSTVILVFQKERVCMDADLLANTEKGAETLVKLGERIGLKKNVGEAE